jgi:hypothetical protein
MVLGGDVRCAVHVKKSIRRSVAGRNKGSGPCTGHDENPYFQQV